MMKFKDFSLGDKVKLKCSIHEGIVIGLDIHYEQICVHYEEASALLGIHVDNNFAPERYTFISNITDYHNKGHTWMEPLMITEIISGKQESKETVNPGCSCSICYQFNSMAEPNQPDNTFKCYSCRNQPLRAYY